MPTFPAEKTFDGVPVGAQIRGSIKNTKTFQVRNGEQVKMNYYTPTNPQTEAQQAHRAFFTEAIGKWQDLTEQQRNLWRAFILPS